MDFPSPAMFSVHLVLLIVTMVQWVTAAPSVPNISGIRTGFACEGYMLNLDCAEFSTNHRLKIVDVLYGRLNRVTCAKGQDTTYWSINCYSREAVPIVKERCNDKLQCSVRASNTFLNGDPCRGTPKYLEVRYKCKADESVTMTTEESTQRSTRPSTLTRPTKRPYLTTTKPVTEVTTRGQIGGEINANFCEYTVEANITWTRTKAGKTARKPCPFNPQKKATWACSDENPARWVGLPDVSQCTAEWVNNVERQLENSSVPMETVASVIATNTGSGRMKSADLSSTASLLNRVVTVSKKQNQNLTRVERKKKAKAVTKSIAKAGSNMLSSQQEASWKAMNKTNKAKAAADILTCMESAAFSIADQMNDTEVIMEVSENIILEVNVVKVTDSVEPIVFPDMSALSNSSWKVMSDQVIFPAQGLKDNSVDGLAKVVIISYNEINKYLGPQIDQSGIGEQKNSTLVNTRVLSASINQAKESVALSQPLIFTLQHSNVNYTVNPQCSYLDYTNSVYGTWSEKGCRATASNNTHTTCECNHLTNFAVLLDVTGTELSKEHELSLIIITYVGCIVSLVCLLLSWLTFQLFRNLQSDRNTIHKNLVFCLFVAEIIFLLGIKQADKPVLCSVIAGFLHYYFLASFGWMCLEGIQLYVMLIEVFEAERSRVKYYYLAGYGVPAVIVALSAGISYGIGQPGYGTDKHCWLRVDNGFIWSFVGPVAVVITINIIMLSIAIYMMCKHANSSAARSKDKSRSNNMKPESCDQSCSKRDDKSGENTANGSANQADEEYSSVFEDTNTEFSGYQPGYKGPYVVSGDADNFWNFSNCPEGRASAPTSHPVSDSVAIGDLKDRPVPSAEKSKRSVTFSAPSGESGDSTDVTGKTSKSSSSSSKKQSTPPSVIMAWVKGALVLVVLLGLTWAFGLLFISEETLVMAYVFTVLNSFQGLFIFIFHCLMNEKVQKEYKKCVRRSAWCPMCIRVHYGGHKGAYHVSTSPTPSSTSGNYFQRLWSGRKRKKSARGQVQLHPKSQLKDINIHKARISSGDSGCLSPDTAHSSQLSPGFVKPQPEICLPLETDEGIDLSIIDASVVDSDFVSEYCKNNMTVQNDLQEQEKWNKMGNGLLNARAKPERVSMSSTDKGELSSDYADTEIYKMNDKERMLLEYELENQMNESVISTGEFGVSEVSDEELIKMTERLKTAARKKSVEEKPLILEKGQLKEESGLRGSHRRNDKKPWRSRSEKTLSTVELLGSDDESECNTLKRSMPNLHVISEGGGSHEQLTHQRSVPSLEEEILVDFSGDVNGNGANSQRSKVKRMSSDLRTKFNPHRYRLNSSEC